MRRALLITALTLGFAAPAHAGVVVFSGNGAGALSTDYARLHAAGVQAVRIDIPWIAVQPPGGGGTFDFSQTDAQVAAVRAAGMRVIGILAYGNPDYSKAGHAAAQSPLAGGLPPFAVGSAAYFPPDDPATFAAYARAVVNRYAGDAYAFEVWNEENEGWRFWSPHEDPAAYGRLLCATYAAVKPLIPSLPVLFGGVFFPGVAGLPGTSGPDFVAAAYRSRPGLGGCYDALAYHPYAYPFTAPELDVPVRGSVLSAAAQLRAVLAAAHDRSKPLWITEVGWPTHDGYGVSEDVQARYVARMQAATFADNVPVLTWYTYGDFPDASGVNQEAHFGFWRADDSAKPAVAALNTFNSVFAGASFAADLSPSLHLPRGGQITGGRGFALQYESASQRITALWLASESAGSAQGPLPNGDRTIRVTLPVKSASVTVTDYLGSSRAVAASHGHVGLDVGPGPVYVTDAR